MKYKIKNWSEFQQYKDDRPMHWIKLHNSLLDDYTFNHLPESLQLQLLKLWLVASKNGGKLEGDANWLAKLTNLKKVDINQLITLGFIVRTDSYDTVPREEKRREEKTETNPPKTNGKRSSFAKPSIEEIKEYINEKNYSVNPLTFFNHYESNGWKVGKNSMKCWKAAISNWQTREGGQSKSSYSEGLL